MLAAVTQAFTFRQHCRDPAERGADRYRLAAIATRQFLCHRLNIVRKFLERIDPVLHPFGIAMPALIDRVGGPAALGELVCRRAPRVTGLATAMQKDYGR